MARTIRDPDRSAGEAVMFRTLVATLLVLALAVPGAVDAQAKKLKIGVVFDYTGPLAGGGSDLHALGAKIMIDYFAKRGGVERSEERRVGKECRSRWSRYH